MLAPILAYERTRSAGYALENRVLHLLARVLLRDENTFQKIGRETFARVSAELDDLLRQDSTNIAEGLYPISVLRPESPLKHLARLPRIAWDGLQIRARKKRGRTTEFDETAREFMDRLPRYYKRNFHFQTNGYLSSRSAELYEHQVEILFAGAADAMRRLILAPMREVFGKSDGRGLTFLEVGAGTGATTEFVRLAFPRAKIIASDLSDPYLKAAQRKLSRYPLIDFVQADGAKLPFADRQFDAVYSVFLFHELPMSARKEVLKDSMRVLKDGGFLGLVDSLQQGDKPELDSPLEQFPKDFHEPYYRNYLENPVENLLRELPLETVQSATGFLSKVCWGTKKD